MICPKCGESVSGSYRYLTCPKCGMTFDTTNMKNEETKSTSNHTSQSSSVTARVDNTVNETKTVKETQKVKDVKTVVSKPAPNSKKKDTWNLNDLNTSSQSSQGPSNPSTSSTQKTVFIAIGVFVLVLAAVLGFLFMNGNLGVGNGYSNYSDSSYDTEYGHDYPIDYDDSDSDEDYYETTTTTTITTTENTTTAPSGDWYIVTVGTNNRLNLRSEPSEYSASLNKLDNGTRIFITEVRGNWGKTTYGGDEGWVCINEYGDTYCTKE